MKVKIFGAGSIGNHLAQASRRMGWSVDICDTDRDALVRTKNDIYPARYGGWDEEIGLYHTSDIPISGHDMVIVGTPPDSHMELAISAVKEGAKIVLVEKPLSTPDLSGVQELFEEANNAGCYVFVGYDHAISKSASIVYKHLQGKAFGEVITLDVEFREFWGGIFKAHPWLDGPHDSYLGFWERGGGACGEHSHAINLFQNFAHKSNIGRITEVSAFMDYVDNDNVNYDRNCLMTFRTEKKIVGRVVQDVVTQPTRKWARAQCENGFVEWFCGNKDGIDEVVYGENNGRIKIDEVIKTRPDDFYEEMKHIESAITNKEIYEKSPISLQRGLETMLVIAAAHISSKNNRSVSIDYNRGFSLDAISIIN